MNTGICITELLHCSRKITTTLLIRYTPIQTVFDVKKIKINKEIYQKLPGYYIT